MPPSQALTLRDPTNAYELNNVLLTLAMPATREGGFNEPERHTYRPEDYRTADFLESRHTFLCYQPVDAADAQAPSSVHERASAAPCANP